MIHPDPLPTITAYCNHCGTVTEQYAMHDGGYVCKECLTDPNSRVEWEKDQAMTRRVVSRFER